MYELLIKFRWYAALLAVATLGSVAAYVSQGNLTSDAQAAAARNHQLQAAAEAQPTAAEASDDDLIDKTVGEDTKPSLDPTAPATASDDADDQAEGQTDPA